MTEVLARRIAADQPASNPKSGSSGRESSSNKRDHVDATSNILLHMYACGICHHSFNTTGLSTSCLSTGRLTALPGSVVVAPATISVPQSGAYQAPILGLQTGRLCGLESWSPTQVAPCRRQFSPRPLSPTRTRVLSPRLSCLPIYIAMS